MPHSMPLPELKAWLALSRLPDTGSARVRELVALHGGAEGALRAVGGRSDAERIAADLRWLEAPAHHVVPFTSDDYPPLLARIADAPALLYVRGDPARLWPAQVAMVGSRNASAGGIANARAFAAAFSASGLVVTSGLARGIDAAAHAAAIDADGATIAVCGTGLDRTYPAQHAALAERIAVEGALVSELPLATPPCRDHFPRRNRLIAGLSLGTLVVEAGLESGSLITARLAAEQGREVFAIPGSIHCPTARGCHRLLRQGAKLVECAADVLDELGPLARELGARIAERLASEPVALAASSGAPARRTRVADTRDDSSTCRLLRALGHDPTTVDELVARSGLTAATVSSMLTVLELEGVVAAQPGSRYVRLAS